VIVTGNGWASKTKGEMMLLIQCTPVPHDNVYNLDTSIYIDGVKIPKGFRWDGASIPRFLWALIYSPFHPDVMAPSMVHDYLYRYHDGQDGNRVFTRKAADDLFEKLLIANGVATETVNTMYSGVRIGGKSSWRVNVLP